MRIFFDTNVLVSAHTARGLSADLMRLVLGEHEFLTGEVNLEEFRRVLEHRFRVPATAIAEIQRDLRAEAIIPRPTAPSALPRTDPADRWVLASAVAGGADILVTGDRHLLEVASEAPLEILSPRACWERLRGSDEGSGGGERPLTRP